MKTLLRRALLLALAAILSLPCASAWDGEEDYSIADISNVAIITYNNVTWPFPVDPLDMDADLIRLANKEVFLPKDFTPDDLVDVKRLKLDEEGNNISGGVRMVDSSWQLQKDCYEALVRLCDAARADGYELYLKSGYRSYYKQAVMYENRLEKYGYDDGWVTKPGASDHQTGLGCDVVPKSWTDRGMNEDMAKEPECQWMAAHCAEFGFILRYPEDKQQETQINYEPWHLRYVGEPVARYIMDNGLCLEEFHEQLQAAIDQFLADGGPAFLVEKFVQVSAEDRYK